MVVRVPPRMLTGHPPLPDRPTLRLLARHARRQEVTLRNRFWPAPPSTPSDRKQEKTKKGSARPLGSIPPLAPQSALEFDKPAFQEYD
jgi:hypothetical protein